MPKHSTRDKYKSGVIRNDIEKLGMALVTTARDMRGEARRALSDSYADVKNKTSTIRNNVKKVVIKTPAKALSIAAASGFVIGLLARGGKKRHKHKDK